MSRRTMNSSAEKDYAEAFRLGGGLNQEKMDMPKSVELFQRVAAKNLPEADARLAFWTSSGNEALVKDTAKAEQWGKKALADGLINKAPRNPAAQTELANTVLLSKDQLRKLSDEILS
jgi:TPR repeat protein